MIDICLLYKYVECILICRMCCFRSECARTYVCTYNVLHAACILQCACSQFNACTVAHAVQHTVVRAVYNYRKTTNTTTTNSIHSLYSALPAIHQFAFSQYSWVGHTVLTVRTINNRAVLDCYVIIHRRPVQVLLGQPPKQYIVRWIR